MSVTLTDKALGEVKRLMQENDLPDSTVLRVAILSGGCSGFEYSLLFDESADAENDVLCEQSGVRIAVSREHLQYLSGTVIDYHDSLMKRGFVFNNPMAVRTCGCGSSFGVAKDAPAQSQSGGSCCGN
ncbi:iron-sulfur cluster assembly accessory protein [Thermostilla marina]